MFNRFEPSAAEREFETSFTELMSLPPLSALHNFHARHDDLIESVSNRSDKPRACVKGCGFCCHLKVVADAVEIFSMVDYVKANLSQTQIDGMIQGAKQNVEEARNLSHEEQATINQQCPLLVDNACAIYPVRSIKCRNYHSMDEESCRASYQHPEDLTILNNSLPQLYVAATGSGDGFMAALHNHGYDDRIYDFNAAFVEAMESPQCKRRYHSKQRAFTSAKFNNA
jgi:Fe-S-cluster containining protein